MTNTHTLYDLLDKQDAFSETINTPEKIHWLYENNFSSWDEWEFNLTRPDCLKVLSRANNAN